MADFSTKYELGGYVRINENAFDMSRQPAADPGIILQMRTKFLGQMGRVNGIHINCNPSLLKIVYDVGLTFPEWVQLPFTEDMLDMADQFRNPAPAVGTKPAVITKGESKKE